MGVHPNCAPNHPSLSKVGLLYAALHPHKQNPVRRPTKDSHRTMPLSVMEHSEGLSQPLRLPPHNESGLSQAEGWHGLKDGPVEGGEAGELF